MSKLVQLGGSLFQKTRNEYLALLAISFGQATNNK